MVVSGRRIGSSRAAVAALAAVALVCSLSMAVSAPEPVRAGERNPILDVLNALAAPGPDGPGVRLRLDGEVVHVDDPNGDVTGTDLGGTDIDQVEVARVEKGVIDALFAGPLKCGMANVACHANNQGTDRYASGALAVFAHRAMPLGTPPAGARIEGGFQWDGARYPSAPLEKGNPFSGTSHDVIVRVENGVGTILYFAYVDGQFQQFQSQSRAFWTNDATIIFIPFDKEIQTDIEFWDWYSFYSNGTPDGTGRDNLRGFDGDVLGTWTQPGTVLIDDSPLVTGPPVTEAPVVTAPSATVAPVATPPTATATPTPTSGGGQDGVVPIVLIAAGLALAGVGAFLLLNRKRPTVGTPAGPAGLTGGGGPVLAMAVDAADPCPPLLEAARRARAACEEALKAAAAAADRAREAAAEVTKRTAELEAARKAREAAEKELARRQKEPDRSSWMSSGDQYEDSYDLKLKADARAAANAAHADALKNAGSDAERGQAHRDWQEQLEHIDSQEGLDELRRNDQEGRAKWVKEAEEALKAAQQAEADAQAAFDAATAAERAASTAASEARTRADAACDAAKAAEQAAMDAGCMPGATPPRPEPPKPDEPKPPKPDDPKPDDPKPTDAGGGGGKPTKPEEPPPVGGRSGGGGETPSKPRQCEDGAQDWRREQAPVGAFLVPIPGAKIQISSSPSFEALDEYLNGWKGYDADSKLDPEAGAGVPPGAFRRADASRWSQLFGKVERKAMEVTIEVVLPLQLVRTHCERLYECRDGAWVRTNRCRSLEHEPEPKPKVMTFESDGARLNEIVTFMQRCVNEWLKAEDAVHELATFSNKCCK